VYPLRLDGVQPRTLLRKQATDDPHSTATVFDSAVMLAEPAPNLFGDMPTGVVPDEHQHLLLARRFELLATPLEKLRRYGAHRPAIDESQPRLVDLGQVESVEQEIAFGSGSSLATDFWRRRSGLPSSAQLLKVGSASRLHQHSSIKPTAHSGLRAATYISQSRRLFFFRTKDQER
jgi:hypothetical protein